VIELGADKILLLEKFSHSQAFQLINHSGCKSWVYAFQLVPTITPIPPSAPFEEGRAGEKQGWDKKGG